MIGNQPSLTGNIASKTISVIATAGQTLFTVRGGYNINQINVYRNGVRLVSGRDYNALNGASVSLLSPATVGDVIDFQIFDDFRAGDALNVNTGGDVFGDVTVNGTVTATDFSGDGSALTNITVSNVSNITNAEGNIGVGTTARFITAPTYNAGIGSTSTGNPNVVSGTNNTSIGRCAGGCMTSGENNVLLGAAAGQRICGGSRNNFFGNSAGQCTNSGNDNNFFGQIAGGRNLTGNNNNFFGSSAGRYVNASDNVAIGECALSGVNGQSVGDDNIAFGARAGMGLTSGCHNFFAGANAGAAVTSGIFNTFIGRNAGCTNTCGGSNIFVGRDTGCDNTVGCDNIFLGRNSGSKNTTGGDNVLLGYQAGTYFTTASNNVAIGRCALRGQSGSSTGGNNIAIGAMAGGAITSGAYNVFFGQFAGCSHTEGLYNIFIGCAAGRTNTTGRNNIFMGVNAGVLNESGRYNNFFGNVAGGDNTSGCHNNFFGQRAGCENTTGCYNNILGAFSGTNNIDGCHNNFLGCSAGLNNTSGCCNVAIGREAMCCNLTGNNNTYVGDAAGLFAKGSNNTFLGGFQGTAADETLNNTIILNTGTTERLRINSAGDVNVGGGVTFDGNIQTTDGQLIANRNTASGAADEIFILNGRYDSNTNVQIMADGSYLTDGDIRLGTITGGGTLPKASARIDLDNNGNAVFAGIVTTGDTIQISNPDTSISAADQTIGTLEFKANDTSGDGSQVTGSIKSVAQAAFTGQGSPAHLDFSTNGLSGPGALARRMRITYGGNVEIGPAAGIGVTLNANGTASFANDVNFGNTVGSIDDSGIFLSADNGNVDIQKANSLSVNTNDFFRASVCDAGGGGVERKFSVTGLGDLEMGNDLTFGNTNSNVSIRALDGDAYFAGIGTFGNTLAGGDGVTIPNGEVQIRKDGATAPVLEIFRGGGADGNRTIIFDNDGDASFDGAVSKGSGSFKIDHPIAGMSTSHHLVHSFIEGPQADLIYRGQETLVGGIATVNIDTVSGMTDGTFVLLNTNISCFTSNETDWTPVRGSVTGNLLTIEAQDNTSTAKVSWMVVGERQDQHMKDTNWTDENGKVIVEPLKPVE